MKLVPVSYKIIYNNKDITRDITDHLISLTYTDKVQGEADELEIELDDKDGLWQNDWYPEKGATIEAQINDDGLILPCGKFTIDEIRIAGDRSSGDTVTISGIAASISKKMRTKKSTAHENKTLRQLAAGVASLHGLTVQGTIPDITINRISQNRESDLSFLNRIALMYGLVFSVRDTQLIFQKEDELQSKTAVFSIDKTECEAYDFTDKTEDTYKTSNVKYHNSATDETIDYTATDDGDGLPKEDILSTREKAENQQQAELMAKSKLNRKNKKEKTCSISSPGNPFIVSGNNIEVTGFGKVSGRYHVTESAHTISRESYSVSWEGKKVASIAPALFKPKKKKKAVKPVNVITVPLRNASAGDQQDVQLLRSRNFVPKTFAE